MRIVIILVSILISISSFAQDLNINTYGDRKEEAIIFLHGGPGYNSVSFERTTANRLAENGFFVISYDRRGEGRSESLEAKYSFEQTNNDLDSINKKYNLTSANLVGHSFGGIVAVKYAKKNPQKVNSITLIGAPVSMQESFRNIIAKSKEIYQDENDVMNLKYIEMLEEMDTTSLMYSSYSFMHALQNGFYSTKNPNKKAIELYSLFKTDTLLIKYASKMGYKAPQKFWENEKYTTLSIKSDIAELKDMELKLFGLYGKEDGLYSEHQIEELSKLIGNENILYLENCSHNVFIDQQETFINSLSKWIKE